MCGICGIINFNNAPVEEGRITSMMKAMKHRGPDDEGLFVEHNIGLGHVRLSIIDLSADGHQPFICKDDRYVLVYNGEIYNYVELKQQLSSKFDFKTKTDTEVLLNAYKHWGKSCMEYLNGMFAFAIYDKQTKELFIARDRFGIKPFYYSLDDSQFVFASDIPPILTMIEAPEQNDQAIYDFLVFDRVQHTENTFFKRIKKLQHGHSMVIKGTEVKMKRWYNLAEKINTSFASSDEYRDALTESIKLRLRSDVPVGACLSGGLDSSTIVSLWLKHFGTANTTTFSAAYNPGEYGDESEYINIYDSQVPNMFYTQPNADTLYDDLNTFVTALSEPIPSTSEYAEFKVMELAKDRVTVVLNGQGADEALAGYHYFFGFYFKELLRQLNLLKLTSETIHYLTNHRSTYGFKALAFFLLPAWVQSRLSVINKGYIDKSFSSQFQKPGLFAKELYGANTLQQSFLNHFEYKFEHNLLWGDKSSMWFSLELRFPFLDHNLVEKTIALGNDNFIQNGQTKAILREALKGILPEAIRKRKDKIGFATPEDQWLRNKKFQSLIVDLLTSRKFKERGYIEANNALEQYQKHLTGEINIGKEIWKWINLEIWFRNFIDKEQYVVH